MTTESLSRRRRSLQGLTVAVAAVIFVATWVTMAQSPGHATRPPVGITLLDGSSPTTTTPDTTTSTTTATETVPSPPPPAPAPTDYGTQLDDLYSQLYSVAQALPGAVAGAGETSPSDFATQVGSANASNLAYVNQDLPESTIENVMSSVTAALPTETGAASALHVQRTHSSRATTYTRDVGHTRHEVAHFNTSLIEPQALTTVPATLPNTDPYVNDQSNSYTATCPTGAPPINSSDTYDTGVLFALQIALDVTSGAYAVTSPGAGTDGAIPIGLAVAAGVIAAIGLALQIASDTLSYFQTIANDCQEAQMQQVGIDTDNTAFQTYTLLTAVAGTANETDQEVANLTNQETAEFEQQLTADIEAALTAPVGTTPIALFELPVSFEGLTIGGYLNAAPVGVNEVVATAISNMQVTGATMGPDATRDQTLANQSLAAGQFKLAFDYFRLAYQAAAG
jgi:hypothetical protein